MPKKRKGKNKDAGARRRLQVQVKIFRSLPGVQVVSGEVVAVRRAGGVIVPVIAANR